MTLTDGTPVTNGYVEAYVWNTSWEEFDWASEVDATSSGAF